MNRQLTLLIVSVLLNSCGALKRTNSPFIGAWEINLGGCTETWIVEKNGIRRSISSEEKTVNKYTLSKIENNVYEFIDTRVSSNFKKDCFGEISKIPNGHVAKNRIKFMDKDKFILCYPDECLTEYPFIRKK